MIQDNIVVEVERRTETGKNAANRLRANDEIPAVIYGGGKDMETLALKVPRKSLVNLMRKGIGENTIFKLQMKGTDQQRHVMIRDMALDPISRALLHVDFVRILLDKKLRVEVPVEIVGTAFGVKNEGGLLNIVTHDLEVECLPADIPPTIKVDVTELHMHGAIRVSDLTFDAKTRVLEASDRVIVHVAVPKAEEVAPAAAAAVEGVAAEAAPAEPEVIKKGKKETEEGAAEAAPAKAEKAEKPAKGEKKEKK